MKMKTDIDRYFYITDILFIELYFLYFHIFLYILLLTITSTAIFNLKNILINTNNVYPQRAPKNFVD
jgi:hypothetical protein